MLPRCMRAPRQPRPRKRRHVQYEPATRYAVIFWASLIQVDGTSGVATEVAFNGAPMVLELLLNSAAGGEKQPELARAA